MNKHLRTLIAILLVAVMVLGVVGCAAEEPADTSDPAGTTAPADNGNKNDDNNGGSNNGGSNNGGNGGNGGGNGPVITNRDHDIALNATGVKVVGFKNATRTLDEGVYLDWAGSAIEFNTEFLVKDTARIWVTALAEDEEVYCYFNVYVDGNLAIANAEVQCAAAEETYIDVADIAAGNHVIKLEKLTDGKVTSAIVTGITFSGNLKAFAAADTLNIEFIGGAAMVGAGMGEDENGDPCDDMTLSFAWQAASALAAAAPVNYQITAEGDWDAAMALANYTKSAPSRDESIVYRFMTDAQLVVIALEGTKDEYAALIEAVRNWNDPQTKIVLCALDATAATAIDELVEETDVVGVYGIDLSESEALAADLLTGLAEVLGDGPIEYPQTPGSGSVQDWEDGV